MWAACRLPDCESQFRTDHCSETSGSIDRSRGQPQRHDFKEIRFWRIRALIEAVARVSFAEAARQMLLSIPSVWRQLRAQETEFGVSLVIAQGRQQELRGQGLRLAELATPLVEGSVSVKGVFADHRGRLPWCRHRVAPITILIGPLRDILFEYRQIGPGVGLPLTDVPSRPVGEWLAPGDAHVVLVNLPGADTIPTFLGMTPLARFPFQIGCPVGHLLRAVRRLTSRDVGGIR